MLRRLGLLILAFVLAGCGAGAIQTTPDEVLTVGGLKPNMKDKDAGLVAIAPGFDLKKYKLIAVEKFPVTDPAVKDEDDRRFGAKMSPVFQVELVRRLRDTKLFEQVVDISEIQVAPGSQALRLEGVITRLGRGDRALRMWVGGGAGAARAQAELRFVDVASGQVVMATADRRIAKVGGSSTELVEESFDDMARDLAKFLIRLSKGEAPKD
ncbi:MAG: hypothetical protein DMD99_16925 [Candidatus Rokuibacteriota bacterium]|nr:MAG: hypothetical protein DMD99_16925 [Candidatus Rokubacteria bacterium]